MAKKPKKEEAKPDPILITETEIDDYNETSSEELYENNRSLIQGDHVYVVYNKSTKECETTQTIDCSDPDLDLSEVIAVLPMNDDQGVFKLESNSSISPFPTDNIADLENFTMNIKPWIDLTVEGLLPVAGDVVTINVAIRDCEGNDISDQCACVLKIKDRLGGSSLEKTLLHFPEDRTFRIKRDSPGLSAIRAKDTMFKYVQCCITIDFRAPEIDWDKV